MKHTFFLLVLGLSLFLAGCGANNTSGAGALSSSPSQSNLTNNSSTSGTSTTDTTNSSSTTTTTSSGSSTPVTTPPGNNNSGNGSGSGDPGTSNGLPTPPSSAIVFSHLEKGGNWQSCNSPACAGGGGKGTYWLAQNQSSPSQDGSSMEFFNSGVWTNALFWQYLGPKDDVSNFLWDFYFYLDDSSQTATQALEFDMFQFVNGYNYMMGSECDYGRGVWDSWDEASNKWIHTSIPCKKFTSNTWHHIQWYITADQKKHQYTYITLVIDGNPKSLNVTGNARDLGWVDQMGVQWQLDVNATGQGYHEWVDQATLTVW
ncbi:MAG: hypothetical protein ACLPND_18875 [Candidatus Korobacteraceae bacterium]